MPKMPSCISELAKTEKYIVVVAFPDQSAGNDPTAVGLIYCTIKAQHSCILRSAYFQSATNMVDQD